MKRTCYWAKQPKEPVVEERKVKLVPTKLTSDARLNRDALEDISPDMLAFMEAAREYFGASLEEIKVEQGSYPARIIAHAHRRSEDDTDT